MASSPISTTSSSTTITNSSSSSSSSSSVTVVMASPPPPLTNTKQQQHRSRSLVPPRWADAVRVVGMSECREAALTLAYAFAADDYARYLVVESEDGDGDGDGDGDEDENENEDDGDGMHGRGGGRHLSEEARWRLHVDILTYTVASTCVSGLVTTVGPEYDAVALWVPPGKHLDGWWTQLRSGMWRLYFQLSPEGKKRYFQEIIPLLHDTKAAVLGDRDKDAWYLNYLGTKPSSQGRGYASKLLRDMMARADAENRPIYLESSSQANNAYYEKFGFEVKRDIFLERGPVPIRLSIMVREPRAPGCQAAYPSASPAVVKKLVGGKKFLG